MGNMNEIIDRLKTLLNIEDDGKLAEKMGVKVSTFGNWKKRNTIKIEVIFPFCEKEKLDLRYVLSGKKEEVLINFQEENYKMIENLNKKEHENLYHILKSNIIKEDT